MMKTLIIASIIVIFSSCSKENPPPCEEWEVVYEKNNIGGCNDLGCAGSRTLQLIFCGDALKDAKTGNTVITSEDQCCRKTMTFNRFVRKI